MAFSDNLLYLRKKYGLTQEQLAEEFEVSRQAVSKWETDEAFPETEKLLQMCDRFSVTMDELLRGNVAESDNAPVCGTEETDTTGEEKSGIPQKRKVAMGAFDSAIWVLAVAIYLVLGFVCKLWHPGWIIFIVAAAVCELIRAVVSGASFKSHCAGAIGSAVTILSVAGYLLMGFVWNLWHPGWVIFIFAIAISSFLGAFFRSK